MSEVSSKPRNLGCVRGYFIRVCSEWGDRQFEFLPTRWYTIPVYQMHNVIYKESRENFVYVGVLRHMIRIAVSRLSYEQS